MPVRGLIGGKEAIDHEAEVAPTSKTIHDQVCQLPTFNLLERLEA